MHVHVQLVVGLAHEDLERIITVNILYLVRTIFGVFQILCHLAWMHI